eukprot:876085-Rhodomonas_salina.1
MASQPHRAVVDTSQLSHRMLADRDRCREERDFWVPQRLLHVPEGGAGREGATENHERGGRSGREGRRGRGEWSASAGGERERVWGERVGAAPFERLFVARVNPCQLFLHLSSPRSVTPLFNPPPNTLP